MSASLKPSLPLKSSSSAGLLMPASYYLYAPGFCSSAPPRAAGPFLFFLFPPNLPILIPEPAASSAGSAGSALAPASSSSSYINFYASSTYLLCLLLALPMPMFIPCLAILSLSSSSSSSIFSSSSSSPSLIKLAFLWAILAVYCSFSTACKRIYSSISAFYLSSSSSYSLILSSSFLLRSISFSFSFFFLAFSRLSASA